MIRTLAGFAVRHRLTVLLLWVVVVGAGFGIGTRVFSQLVPDVGSAPGSESERADERLDHAVPRPETITAVIAGAPADDPALLASTEAAIAAAREVPGVVEVSDPLPAATGRALLVTVTLAPGEEQDDAAALAAERLRAIDAPEVAVSGGPLMGEEMNAQAQADVARAELLSMPVVLILLLLVFGGVLAAGLPLLVAVVGIGATFGILYAFSTVTDVSVYAIQVTTMLAVGLGVDYALLMVSRFREERRRLREAGRDSVPEAVAATAATAGRTVLFSGLTVAVALAGLVVFPDPFLRSMGLAGAAVVLVDMAAALTLLPALLSRFGHRISPARGKRSGSVFARVARGVQRRPVVTLLTTAVAMLVLAGPVLGMRISQGDPRMLPADSQAHQLWDGLATHFADRVQQDPIEVVAQTSPDDPALSELEEAIAALPGVARVQVEAAGPGLTLLRATTVGDGAADDATARAAVADIRALPAPFPVEVTGTAAHLVDYQRMLVDRLPWAIALVGLLTLLLLFAFTGSVVLPVKALLTNLLSIGASLGVVVWVFQHGHLSGLIGTEGLDYVHLTVPVLVGAIALGLSVDYEVFLLSRIRERWLAGITTRDAVAEGLQRTGGIVTAAALLIAVVFAGFVAGGFAPIKAVGVGLVLAVALDATVVRMLLVPATMTLLGRRNWWLPRPLRRLHDRIGHAESEAPAASPARAEAAGASPEPAAAR